MHIFTAIKNVVLLLVLTLLVMPISFAGEPVALYVQPPSSAVYSNTLSCQAGFIMKSTSNGTQYCAPAPPRRN